MSINNMNRKIIFNCIIIVFSFLSCKQNSQTTQETHQVKSQEATSYKDINSTEFNQLAQQANTLVIDVRTPEEVSEGKIQQADLFIDFTSEDFDAKIDSLDKSKTYIVYCKAGGRSARAAQTMIDKGFENVYNLQGGISSYKE